MSLTPAGEVIPVEMTANIIYEGDKEVASTGIFYDLREKIAAEKKLKEILIQVAQSEKMASLGQLAAGVAHEINNPLTGILLYANLALERFDNEDPVRKYLKSVIDDADRCRDIVKNLLAYSRQASPTKEIFQVNSLVEHSLNLIRDQELFLNITVVKEMSEEMMLIHTDKNQLSQVHHKSDNECRRRHGEKGNPYLPDISEKTCQKGIHRSFRYGMRYP